MCYSDFPIPQEFPIFMHNTYVLKYFHLYAEKFNLKEHINFKTEVFKTKKQLLQDISKWILCSRRNKAALPLDFHVVHIEYW